MRNRNRLALGALALMVAVLCLLYVAGPSDDGVPASTDDRAAAPRGASSATEAREGRRGGNAAAAEQPSDEDPPQSGGPAPHDAWSEVPLRGAVVGENGRPVSEGVAITAESGPSGGASVEDLRIAADGTFSMRLRAPAGESEFRLVARQAATGHRSAVFQLEAMEDFTTRWVLFLLRERATVSGRVVTASGGPLPGVQVLAVTNGLREISAWNAMEGTRDVVTCSSGADGRFSLAVPRRDGGVYLAPDRAVARAPTAYDAASGDVDVGDVVLDDNALVEWTVRLVEADGSVLAGGVVRADIEAMVPYERHRSFDATPYRLRTSGDGSVTLRAAVDPRPLVVGVGSPAHVTRAIALDRATAGERTVDISLERRPEIRVVLEGIEDARIGSLPVALEVESATDPDVEFWVPRDPATGDLVEVAESRALPPAQMIEWDFEERAVERIDAGTFRVRRAAPGATTLRLRIGDRTVLESPVEFVARPAVPEVVLRVPGGRGLRIDTADVEAWFAKQGGTVWIDPWCAWIAEPDPAAVERGERGERALTASHHVALGGSGEDCAATKEMWLPAGTEYVAFGFLQQTRMGSQRPAPDVRVVYVATPPADVETIRAPAPTGDASLTARVVVQVTLDGAPVRQAGIPVSVHQIPGKNVSLYGASRSLSAATDADGQVVFRGFAGRYAVNLDRSVGESTVCRFDAHVGATEDVVVAMSYPQ